MATDLTPPAGTDEPGAEPAPETTALAATPAPPPAGLVASMPHRARFAFLYGALGAVLVAAIAGVAIFASHSISPGPKWSTWKPNGGGLGASKQIAEHVGAAYHLPGGEQMVDVIAKAPSVSPASSVTIPIHYLAVRGTKGQGDQITTVSSSDSVMYSLCGLGASCAIAKGKASVERGRLVRREIFELALYTFKYVGGVKNVIAFMPPQPGAAPKYVVYLRKDDLRDQLKQPLVTTLAAKAPLPKTIPAREVHSIDSITEPRVFSFSLSQAQQGDAILVLAPLPA
jgi:hypothetical protein